MQQLDTDVSLPQRLTLYREKITEYGIPLEHRKIPGVDKRLSMIIERCLHPVAEKRFQNVQQVLQALASRDKALAKRPMMLLGVVGPLLLLVTTCFLSWRMMGEAREQTTGALRKAALDQCRFAAKWVASGIEADLRAYFQTIEIESQDEELLAALARFKEEPPPGVSEVPLGRSAQASAGMAATLEENLAAKEISRVLQKQLKKYGVRQSWEDHRPVFATSFVTDRRGTIIAVAYAEDSGPYQSSLGGNYVYRTYFHGGAEDLPLPLEGTIPLPIRNTHLSSPFSSMATGLWKVAVSTPIRLPGSTQEGSTQEDPDFLFVATINLGEFRLLDKTTDSASELAVLVDSRPMEFGTILQHPLMDRRMATTGSFGTERYVVAAQDLRPLLREGLLDYRDPMARAPGGDPYVGSWIATAQRVTLPIGTFEDVTEPREASSLAVLVQYKLERVLRPVGVMMETLLLLGAVTIGSILVVMAGLWYFVMRFHEER
jgi:hypothetical protein